MRTEAAFLLRGLLAHVPWYRCWLLRRARTGGTDSARYCYSVCLRHLVRLEQNGVEVPPRRVAELGPGDSIGVGLAMLLAGAERYVALDVFPYSNPARWLKILDELLPLFQKRAPIPDGAEFPEVRPVLADHRYPERCLHRADASPQRVRTLREEIAREESAHVRYVCPWHASSQLEPGSIDLLFSQAVMEHVLDLDATHRAAFAWLAPGGRCSHTIDFRCHGTSSVWNGHWRYPEPVWNLAMARREFTMNRRSLSQHLASARSAGFEVVHQEVARREDGLPRRALAREFRDLPSDDLSASGVHLILRRPP